MKHLLVIEEAHRLLKNVQTERTSELIGNPKGKAVEFFCNVIAEMRSLGQGTIVAEQIPTKIAPDVIKNTNTKIVHRLVSKDDQIEMANCLGLSEIDALYLNRLKTGFALCHKEGMDKPVEVKIYSDINEYIGVSDSRINTIMQQSNKESDEKFNQNIAMNMTLNEFIQHIDSKVETIFLHDFSIPYLQLNKKS